MGIGVAPVAYLVFYTVLPVPLPDGGRFEPPLQGPLRDENGVIVRLPLTVDTKSLPFEPGKYRLVPVDEDDEPIDDAEPIEVVVGARLTQVDPSVMFKEVFQRALDRFAQYEALHGRLGKPLSDDVMLLTRLHVQRQAAKNRTVEAITVPRATRERDEAIESLVEQLFELLAKASSGEPSALEQPVPLTTSAVVELVNEPLRCTLDKISTSIGQLDFDDALARTLARMSLGIELSANELVDLLPGVDDPFMSLFLVAVASQGGADAALHSVRTRMLTGEIRDATACAFLLFGAWECGDRESIRPTILPLARAVARADLESDARALICALSDSINDSGLAAIVSHFGRSSDDAIRDAVDLARHTMHVTLEDVISTCLGSEPRALSRNAPCPCGSGKKVKRCCGQGSSTTVRVSTKPSPEKARRVLTAKDVWRYSLPELARLPVPEVAKLLPELTNRFADQHYWKQAIGYANMASKLGVQPAADHCHAAIVHNALEAGLVDLAEAHVQQMADRRNLALISEIVVALLSGEPNLVERLTEHEGALREPVNAEMLAVALLGAVPAIGLPFARGCIHAESKKPEFVVEAIERARDRAGLPPFDSAWEAFKRLRPGSAEDASDSAKSDAARAIHEIEKLNARLAREAKRIAEQEREIQQLRDSRVQSPPVAPLEPEERRSLRARIEELEAIIRERNEERVLLRRALRSQASPPTMDPMVEPEPDGRSNDEAVAGPPRRVLLPQVGRNVAVAMRDVPQHVAAEAMRTIGQLAAGDVAAWQSVKQLKGTAARVYSARIGIHHRLVFRIADDALHADDLITREDLHTSIKRIRATT